MTHDTTHRPCLLPPISLQERSTDTAGLRDLLAQFERASNALPSAECHALAHHLRLTRGGHMLEPWDSREHCRQLIAAIGAELVNLWLEGVITCKP